MYKDFEDFMVEKNDRIYGLAFELLSEVVNSDINAPQPEWDMMIINAVVESAVESANAWYEKSCHPFFSSEVPCYLTDECDNDECVFRRGENDGLQNA